MDPFEEDMSHLDPPSWLVDQLALDDPFGVFDREEFMNTVRELNSDSSLDEDGNVDMSNVRAIRPASKAEKRMQTKSSTQSPSPIPHKVVRSPDGADRAKSGNIVRLVTPSGQKLKRCTKCGETKPMDRFDPHSGSADGRQAYCKQCKSKLNKLRRDNSPAARLKHHIASRCMKQVPNCPGDLTTYLEEYLGYSMLELVNHLDRDIRGREGISLEESFRRGYHMDHKHPLSRYKPLEVGDEEFRKCWALNNLWMIPGEQNLKKGAKVDYDRPE
jgi:hypothetical protein